MEKDEFLEAVARGDLDAARSALEAGTDPDCADRLGMTALLRAAGQGDGEMVALLLEHGAQVDKSSDQGNTPLMFAAARGHAEIMRQLLSGGADPAKCNKWEMGPRDWAKWPANSGETLSVLLEATSK